MLTNSAEIVCRYFRSVLHQHCQLWIQFIDVHVQQEKDIRRLAGTVPNATATGDLESMAMYAGQGVGLIKEILPAHEVVKRLVAEAQFLIRQTFSCEIC